MKVIYPGSFDPITIGHLDIIKRLNDMFDEVIIAILINEAKHSLFSIKERKQLIEKDIEEYKLENVKVKTFEGLLVDFAKKENSKIIVRGIRAIADYEYEMNIAQFNTNLYPGLETIFLLSDPKFSFISSSGVRELASFGGDVSKFVSKNVKKAIYEKNNLGGKNNGKY
ncbi:MAG: pantetheine-phosphate adenylyltransferase [Anaerococcus sp.]|uniref:pantetheine-phosphate adenylyltransferase n=1 Tax=Anaerococcus jeddahensis TaxID=1673719 RepID=UPI0006723C96|nr:pantetheine-phosphate adenylyltransferase [Anaerococcus jeddahensis]KXA00062.1 pantetheine-phosphate adenylyltransferase [Anaerococcus hydrogenalis]MDU2829753.1 pantetheine-phosphate adenylyltransferase [Anaerococcus sp.]MDU5913056.1 pantetheine-phosphate adenylyltransferase [Anaerococcus vaginalis]MDU6064567.1 pantetheine-phosphate adenylyltransferase [Anaerococcus sp.]MDU6791764.1 pantetheine-phosphate adenylyltransferase [Anaerococcus sp.]